MIDSLEKSRLAALMALRVLDTPADPAIDRIVALAADLFATPLAAVSLLDDRTSWIKWQFGAPPCETDVEYAFCAHTLKLPAHDVLIVEDLTKDDRFNANPLVAGEAGLRFYAGALLTSSDGYNLGTLCVVDTIARETPSAKRIQQLQSLAAMVVSELERVRDQRIQIEQKRLLGMAEAMSGVGHWRYSVANGHVVWSDEVYRIHGVEPGTFDPNLGDALSFYHEDDRPILTGLVDQSIRDKSGYDFELRLWRKDGALRDVMARATCELDAQGEVSAMFGVFQDVTERKSAFRDMHRNQARYKLLADNVADVIARIRLDGGSGYISPAVTSLLGYEPKEMSGGSAQSFVHPDDHGRLLEVFAAMAAGQEEATLQHRAMHREGHAIWVETRLRLVRNEAGSPREMVAVIRDISERKALENALETARAEAEAAAAVKSEFLANMSHELRTPLTSIIGFTGLAVAQVGMPDLARNYVERVENASRALLCTVNDILDFSKLEAGQVAIRPEPTDVAGLCRATLDLFTPQAGSKDIGLKLDLAKEAEGSFMVDPDRVRQILLNLVGNAVKFTEQGEVTLSVTHTDGRLSVSVEDTGAGLAPDKLGRLFQRFSQIDGSLTRSHGGTGLGLAICKGLVEAMNGTIGADSVEGEGSRFWFSVPTARLETSLSASTEGARLDQPAFTGLRVLVVDDHSANRELARLFLSGIGAEVQEADNGLSAVTIAGRSLFDVILMDIRMPQLDGMGALTRIRSEGGPNDATPILAYTADASPDETARLVAMGFDGVVSKPVEPGALIASVGAVTAVAPNGAVQASRVG